MTIRQPRTTALLRPDRTPPELPVSEVFGPTLQGEGPFAGRPASFLRLGGCNLSCSWCDTAYTWDASRYNLRDQIKSMKVTTLVEAVPASPSVVITGGEPLMYQRHAGWEVLLDGLLRRGFMLHLETNGTIPPNLTTMDRFDHISVSPKLANAGDHKTSQDPTPWPGWRRVKQAIVKYVVEDKADVHLAVVRARAAGWPPRRIWVMPQGQTVAELDQRWPEIAQTAADHGINASHRLHVLAWGQDRGH